MRYLITNRTPLTVIERAVGDGVDYVQVREKAMSSSQLFDYVKNVMSTGAKVLVNDRLDVALAAGAAGVHLRSNAAAPARIRSITPNHFLIAVSCHSIAEVIRAENEGADFVVLGPIFAKPDYAPPLGLEVLRQTREAVNIPVFALGGITQETAPLCGDFAAIGLFQELFGA